jgi:hypothetical protein
MEDIQIAGACLIGATALAGAWILSWSVEEPKIEKLWKFGDPPRRPNRPGASTIGVVVHLVGAGFGLTCLVFAAQNMGWG